MSSIIEHIRSLHELAETTEAAVGEEMNAEVLGQKRKVYQQHAIHGHVQKTRAAYDELAKLYEDKDGILKEEIAHLRKDNGFGTFYESLGKSAENHKRNPTEMFEPITQSIISLQQNSSLNVEFSGEEVFGKYLDLHPQHALFCNLPFTVGDDKDYIEFLDAFLKFDKINEKEKEKEKKLYGPYLRSLYDYFVGYIERVKPLVNLTQMLEVWTKEFDATWAEGRIAGWTGSVGGAAIAGKGGAFDLDSFESIEALIDLGADSLKSALESLGLKCGGTPADRAKRLWSVKGLDPTAIPAKLRAKGKAVANVELVTTTSVPIRGGGSSSSGKRELARIEFMVLHLAAAIEDVVHATRRHAEKQQTRSAIEKQHEYEEEESGMPLLDADDGDASDDDEPVHNPLKLPLGWDGKPIPFWMYRLQGLNEKFSCEICGNEVYMGRRNFERHFHEAKHVGNLRSLGIPNSKHFQGITMISDAQTLWAKMQSEAALSAVREAEQYEDNEGNVLDRQTFEARARMGQL